MALKINEDIKVNNGLDLKTISNDSVYSTEEIVIGKWINNKPLYRKIFNNITMPNNNDVIIPSGLQNIFCTRLYGMAASNSASITLPDVNTAGITYCIRLVYNYMDNNIYITSLEDRTAYNGFIILEYTKTTD